MSKNASLSYQLRWFLQNSFSGLKLLTCTQCFKLPKSGQLQAKYHKVFTFDLCDKWYFSSGTANQILLSLSCDLKKEKLIIRGRQISEYWLLTVLCKYWLLTVLLRPSIEHDTDLMITLINSVFYCTGFEKKHSPLVNHVHKREEGIQWSYPCLDMVKCFYYSEADCLKMKF